MYTPVSQNPMPEPHEDVTRSYQWRFRDPNFIAIWSRWWDARTKWSKAVPKPPYARTSTTAAVDDAAKVRQVIERQDVQTKGALP